MDRARDETEALAHSMFPELFGWEGKPTPGPWRAVWTTGAVSGWAIVPEGYGVSLIARVGLPNAIPEKREEADAQLIATAPRLLKALTDLADEFASPHPLSDLRLARINEAHAAIAAARSRP